MAKLPSPIQAGGGGGGGRSTPFLEQLLMALVSQAPNFYLNYRGQQAATAQQALENERIEAQRAGQLDAGVAAARVLAQGVGPEAQVMKNFMESMGAAPAPIAPRPLAGVPSAFAQANRTQAVAPGAAGFARPTQEAALRRAGPERVAAAVAGAQQVGQIEQTRQATATARTQEATTLAREGRERELFEIEKPLRVFEAGRIDYLRKTDELNLRIAAATADARESEAAAAAMELANLRANRFIDHTNTAAALVRANEDSMMKLAEYYTKDLALGTGESKAAIDSLFTRFTQGRTIADYISALEMLDQSGGSAEGKAALQKFMRGNPFIEKAAVMGFDGQTVLEFTDAIGDTEGMTPTSLNRRYREIFDDQVTEKRTQLDTERKRAMVAGTLPAQEAEVAAVADALTLDAVRINLEQMINLHRAVLGMAPVRFFVPAPGRREAAVTEAIRQGWVTSPANPQNRM